MVAKTSAEVYTLPVDIEAFTITIDDMTSNSANLGMMWEKTYVAVPFEVPTDSKLWPILKKLWRVLQKQMITMLPLFIFQVRIKTLKKH